MWWRRKKQQRKQAEQIDRIRRELLQVTSDLREERQGRRRQDYLRGSDDTVTNHSFTYPSIDYGSSSGSYDSGSSSSDSGSSGGGGCD